MMKYKNVLCGTLLTITLHMFAYAFAPDGDMEISQAVSAFISTSTQKIRDTKMALKLYEDEKDTEQIESNLYNLALRVASILGSPNPKPIANIILATTKYYLPFTNYDLEVTAAMYAIGQALEDKDLMPDVDTAVEKANEFTEILRARLDEFSSDSYWGDRAHALVEGTDLFLKHNGNTNLNDFVLAYKRFNGHVLRNLRK